MVELKVGTIVFFPQEDFERVKQIEGRLYDQYRIRFDTGYGSEGREWQLDWSLQHPESMTRQEAMETITKHLDAEQLKYRTELQTYED
jgi:hypothetical protein|tara:strand:- start:658 stop:921 length:264 start_codon:yes stop_codon:yes gene_type:complete